MRVLRHKDNVLPLQKQLNHISTIKVKDNRKKSRPLLGKIVNEPIDLDRIYTVYTVHDHSLRHQHAACLHACYSVIFLSQLSGVRGIKAAEIEGCS